MNTEEILDAAAAGEVITMDEFKRRAFLLKDAGTGKLGQCQQALAKAYGYNTFAHLQTMNKDGNVRRLSARDYE